MIETIDTLLPAIEQRLDREDFSVREMVTKSGNVPGFLLFRDGRLHLVLVDHASVELAHQWRALQKQFEPHFTHIITVLDGDPPEIDWGSLASHFRTEPVEAPLRLPVRCDQWGHLQGIPR